MGSSKVSIPQIFHVLNVVLFTELTKPGLLFGLHPIKLLPLHFSLFNLVHRDVFINEPCLFIVFQMLLII